MEQNAVAIQVLSVCAPDGTIRPLRFRLEDREHTLHTFSVEEIVDSRETVYVGCESFRFLCRTAEGGTQHLMELVYFVRRHYWTLFRVVY